jgi:hypothetical protein
MVVSTSSHSATDATYFSPASRLPLRPYRTARRLVLFATVFVAGCITHSLFSSQSYSGPSALSASSPVRLHFLNSPSKNDQRPLIAPNDCPITVIYTVSHSCHILFGRSNWSPARTQEDEFAADALIIDSDQFSTERLVPRSSQRKVRPWQSQAILAYESAPNRPLLEEYFAMVEQGRREETFEFDMSYRLDSHIPQVYA